MKTTTRIIAVLIIALLCVFSLFACNKSEEQGLDTSDLLNIYKSHSSVKEFTSVKAEISLPSGWSVYTSLSSNYSANSDSGYVKDLDAFIVTNGKVLSVIKCGTNDLMFPESTAITAIKVYYGLIVVKSGDGTISVYNSNGKLKISRANIVETGTQSIASVVKVLSGELVAVNYKYDSNAGGVNYTSIYRVSTGKVACRIKNQSGALAVLYGFDNDYVAALLTVEDSKDTSRMFKIPTNSDTIQNYDGTQLGTIQDNGNTEYYSEITYMGEGRFFVHEEWQVTKDDDYTFYDGDYYMQVLRYVYDADTDTRASYTSNHYFLNLTNKYYDSTRTGLTASSFLNDGFYYASYGISVDDKKVGYYDQFILDSNLDIVLSLTGNFGLNLEKSEVDDVSVFDLAVIFTDEIGVVPVLTSIMRAYNRSGGVLFESEENDILTAAYNNGVIIATTSVNGNTMYGAFNAEGKLIIPFIYNKIDPFTGYYTIAEKTVNNSTVRVLLSKDGTEMTSMSDFTTPLSDLATTTGGTAIYKVGCYMSSEKKADGTTYYGIKNLDANTAKNTLIENRMVTGSTLYAPTNNPQYVFVFAKFSESDNITIYRLI